MGGGRMSGGCTARCMGGGGTQAACSTLTLGPVVLASAVIMGPSAKSTKAVRIFSCIIGDRESGGRSGVSG
jgi:hypothetical protein